MIQTKKMSEKYIASMVLAGVGDCIAFNNSSWEFTYVGREIHDELEKMGGIKEIKPDNIGYKMGRSFTMVSDDTVMLIATAEGIVKHYEKTNNIHPCPEMYNEIVYEYIECFKDMKNRGAGYSCRQSVKLLKHNIEGGHRIPFNMSAGGCGVSMRSMCIGLLYPKPEQIDDLIALSIESGRMTHHNPSGYLGGVASAFLIHCAINNYPINEWGKRLLDLKEKIKEYIVLQNFEVENNLETYDVFWSVWEKFLEARNILEKDIPIFESNFENIEFRDEYYKTYAYQSGSPWPGSSGYDSVIIAYDSILYANSVGDDFWKTMADVSFFHGGDSDSTAVIAGAIYGIMFGFEGVPINNYAKLEKKEKLIELGDKLYNIVNSK